jgi:putative endonuclease
MDETSPSKPGRRRPFGARSEKAAESFLQKLGYRILERNYSCSLGELDLVALEKQCIVFVEVRSTEGDDGAQPAESVDARKQRRLTDLALHYLSRHKLLDQLARFDVLAISWPANRDTPAITHYKDAFDASGRFQMFS